MEQSMGPPASRSCKMWSMLWHKTNKLCIPIPETLVFCDGKFVCWLLNSTKNIDLGVIKKIKPANITIDKLRAIILKASHSERNDTTFSAVHRYSDRSVHVIPQLSLVPTLMACVERPVETSSLSHWQYIRAFVNPLNDVRFVTLLRRRSAEEIELIRGKNPDLDETTLQFAVNIGCRSFRSGQEIKE